MELNFDKRNELILESNLDAYNSKNSNSENDINFIMKDHREQLISKRKEFIQNYRKKQRLLSLMESSTYINDKINNNKNSYDKITIEDIKENPDPISRIILLKKYIYINSPEININFINKNFNIIKEWFKEYKKYLFDFQNKNISKQIIVNKAIIYNILSLLFEPEINPIMDEFDYEFLFQINNFCNYYFKLLSDNNNLKDNKELFLYILFLLNNLIMMHPDVELIKATIDVKNITQFFYINFFSFDRNKNNNIKNYNIINDNNNNDINLNLSNKYELLEFTFIKLIENCINCLHLNDNDIKELLSILFSLLFYNFNNNIIKLIIYILETLIRINHPYLLLENECYSNFLLTELKNFIINYNHTSNNLILLKNKLVLELYLQILILLLKFNNNEKLMINANLFLKEEIVIFFKKYLYQFYNYYILSNKKSEITISELKVVIKIIKIFCVYFDLISSNNCISKILSKFITSYFIMIDKEIPISLYKMFINIFIYFIKINEKNSQKICKSIIVLFNNIYNFKNLDLYKNNSSLIELRKCLISDKNNIHRKILPFLNYEKYPFLVEVLLEFVNQILFYCDECIKEKNENNFIIDKIKKEINDLNVFEELENIVCNFDDSKIIIFAENLIYNYKRNENEEY